MDISDTLAPDSDQLDAIDLATGPRIFTVKSVSKGDAEQPVQVHLVEFPRGPWRPGKNMRRVLAACWGVDASAWAGRRVELYCDPAVRFGADVVGGTRIAKLSHIDKQQKIPLLISRGRSATFTVQPLLDAQTSNSSDRGEDESHVNLALNQATAPQAPPCEPTVPAGGLGEALAALDSNQRKALYEFCGIKGRTSVNDMRGLLADKYRQLSLPDYVGEPVPITVLGALYAEKSKHGSSEAFQRWLDTGESTDPGDQTTLTAEALA